ncbi:MAG: hypothetical protein U0942_05745 [Parvibaculum sp.]|uniref:hypothetical protein n=1 Tax=Parvibaculum sp. TaxID=2024848 RepID=UPI002ABA761C|nr:hypothetical protein [Parvibaculum sp.]MDZ4380823.1 hypothetical protein [Parvibaculum sp.]
MEHEENQDTEHHGDAHREGVSRRTLLVLAGTAIVAAAVPSALFLAEPETAAGRAPGFVKLLADPESAAHLGEVWFEKSAPGETLAVYEARLSRTLEFHGWHEEMDEAETHRVLAQAVRADYAANRVTAIDEWHLSETEANLAALAALIARKNPAHGEEEAHG